MAAKRKKRRRRRSPPPPGSLLAAMAEERAQKWRCVLKSKVGILPEEDAYEALERFVEEDADGVWDDLLAELKQSPPENRDERLRTMLRDNFTDGIRRSCPARPENPEPFHGCLTRGLSVDGKQRKDAQHEEEMLRRQKKRAEGRPRKMGSPFQSVVVAAAMLGALGAGRQR